MGKFRALAFVYRHGKGGFDVRQPRHADAAQLVAIQEIHAQEAVGAGQGDANVAVEHAQGAVVARHHDGAAGVPGAVFHQAFAGDEFAFDGGVQAGHAPVAFAHGAQQTKAFKRLQNFFHPEGVIALRASVQGVQVIVVAGLVAGEGGVPDGFGAPAAVVGQAAIGAGVQHLLRGPGIAAIDGQGQLPNRPAKAPAVAQHDGALRQGAAVRIAQSGRDGLPGRRLGKGDGVGVVVPAFGPLAQVAQHGPGFDRGQLVFVPQDDEAGLGGQGLQQGGHHGQVHHGGFIDDEHIDLQWGDGAGLPRAQLQQAVQGAGCAGALHQGGNVHVLADAGVQAQQRLVDGLL